MWWSFLKAVPLWLGDTATWPRNSQCGAGVKAAPRAPPSALLGGNPSAQSKAGCLNFLLGILPVPLPSSYSQMQLIFVTS